HRAQIVRIDDASSSAFASASNLQWHYLPDAPGDAIFTGPSLRPAARHAVSPRNAKFFQPLRRPVRRGFPAILPTN
ncbi:hypothetical protein, partial [Burkholderia sp. E168m23]|uniref:hypothetical protein n=1 Tax=Burkholderia sp. E168m23 TaxID=1561200 RepID=UPI001F35C2C7